LKVSTSVYKNSKPKKDILWFVDAMINAPGCRLDQFTQDYTDKKF
jgi:hypothetical protein